MCFICIHIIFIGVININLFSSHTHTYTCKSDGRGLNFLPHKREKLLSLTLWKFVILHLSVDVFVLHKYIRSQNIRKKLSWKFICNRKMSVFLMILTFNCENITTKLKISENCSGYSDQWFSLVNLLINDEQYSCA